MDTTETAAAKIDATTAEQPTIEQLTVEVKFYLGQLAQNIIEVGKRLIQAKALLPHGEWQNWLENNFNLKVRMAQNFMACAERFGKTQTYAFLNSSQMIELLRLPEDETEAFIEAKAAQGTPVEDMTIKNLREEVQLWKSRAEVNENAVSEKDRRIAQLATDYNKLQGQNSQLQRSFDNVQRQLIEAKKQPPVTIEKPPADYDQLKRDLVKLRGEKDALQKKLDAAVRNVEIPADYHANKKRLQELDSQITRMQKEIAAHVAAEDYASVAQKLDTILALINDVLNSKNAGRVIADYERNSPARYDMILAQFGTFLEIMK